MDAGNSYKYFKFQTKWDKIVFWGSIAGCILVLVITFMKKTQQLELKNENEMLKKENMELREEVNLLRKK